MRHLAARPLGQHSEAGNITLLFCLLVLVLLGSVSYSLYVGQMVEARFTEQNAADTAALSMANHAAQGLNMMAANNLATAASVQIASSTSNLALYLGIIRTLLYSEDDVVEDLSGNPPAQEDVYDPLQYLTLPFLQAAAGISTLNRQIQSKWLYMAPIRGLDVARVNVPGSLMMPIQKSQLTGGVSAWTYGGMAMSAPKTTVCHAIASVDPHDTQAVVDVFAWLEGPFKTLNNQLGGGITQVHDAVAGVERALTNLTSSLGFVSITPPKIIPDGSNCGLSMTMTIKIQIPFPLPLRWLLGDGIPILDQDITRGMVNFGAQAGAFAGDKPQERGDSFGYIHPIKQDDGYRRFRDSMTLASVVVTPLRDNSILTPENCPPAWQRDGRCDVQGIVGMTSGTLNGRDAVAQRDYNLASGGLNDNRQSGGALASTLSRLKYRLGQASVAFAPNQHDPDGTRANVQAGNLAMQMFWPAWRGIPAESTLLGDVMAKIGDL